MNTNQIRLGADFRAAAPRAWPHAPDIGAWLAWAKNRLEAARGLRQRRQAIAELSRMPDWRLADLGIPRGQIAEVVDGLIAREGPSIRRRAK